MERERERQRTAGVRLVTDEDGLSEGGGGGGAEGGRQRARDDAAVAGLPAPGMEWSPVERRRAMTPTERGATWFTPTEGTRPRAETGESM